MRLLCEGRWGAGEFLKCRRQFRARLRGGQYRPPVRFGTERLHRPDRFVGTQQHESGRFLRTACGAQSHCGHRGIRDSGRDMRGSVRGHYPGKVRQFQPLCPGPGIWKKPCQLLRIGGRKHTGIGRRRCAQERKRNLLPYDPPVQLFLVCGGVYLE